MKKLLFLVFFQVICTATITGQLQSPDEFFPHKRGEHFTHHYQLVDYYQHVAANSPLVKIVEYGMTNQERPLLVAIVTSEANHARLEEIRQNNLRIAGVIDGQADLSLARTLVWISHSVHGNEAAGSESAPSTLYELVDPKNEKTKAWLDNTVVILDPSINPDGYSRYTHWVKNIAGDNLTTNSDDIEHNEPWPGGRVNHYLFDLNRDWAWQTQIESQQRMKLYNQWLPHVHADLHEMGSESPYYFAPAAKPYHKYITRWQRDFQTTIGKNHAKYFDSNGWLYFTKEVFDLFYPSYGDTYPTYSGAIGMTYEQGGSGIAGRGIMTSNGEVLSLKDRVDHHKTTALSTIEISSVHSKEVIDNFAKFYKDAVTTPASKYRTYVIKKDKSGERLKALAQLLDLQGIKYGTVNSKKNLSGFDYSTRANGSIAVEQGDMVVAALQAKGILTQILLDPESELEDSLTYDITAWSLPYAYGLSALASSQELKADGTLKFETRASKVGDAYAYLIPWTDMTSAKAIAALQKRNLQIRMANKAFQNDGASYPLGTLVVTLADNRSKKGMLTQLINEVIEETQCTVQAIQTGFSENGPDLGSGRIELLKKQNVIAVMGSGVSNNDFGQVRWYFDKILNYPLTIIENDRLGSFDLDDYTTLILPSGWYSLSGDAKKNISNWVRDGGKTIAIDRATRNFVDNDDFSLKRHATDDEKKEAEKRSTTTDLAARYDHYSDQERKSISSDVPGAIFKLTIDPTHPLAYGLGDSYYSLRTSSTTYPLIVGQSNVIYHPKMETQVVGFAGSEIKSRLNDSVAFAVENKGRGQMIYMTDNPLFRGFWYNGLFLFSNAVFLVE